MDLARAGEELRRHLAAAGVDGVAPDHLDLLRHTSGHMSAVARAQAGLSPL